ncbi:MAG: cytosine permease [Lawsonibacter sp.]|nr:cytosine permease [Lawsonibacter sp.]
MAQQTSVRRGADDDYSLEAVPTEARKGFWSMFVVMMGFTFFSASMSVGAKLGNGLDLSGFVWAVVIGGVILGAYTGGLAYIGCDTGLTLDLLARHSFGAAGSKLASVLIAFTQIGWFGVGVAMFAIPAAELLGVPPMVLVLLAGGCMTASAYFGIRALTVVSAISVPLIAALGIYSMALSTVEGGGLAAIFSKSAGSLTVMAGVGLVIGSFVSGGTATPNFVRFAKNNAVAVSTTVIAFFLGNSLMFAFGAVGGAFTGKDDIFYVMIAQGLAIPALVVLGANIWTTNNNALYTGGLGLTNITGLRQKPMTLVSGAVGTLAAIWLYNNFVGWLNFLNATLPPVGIIVMLDYLLHRADYRAGAAPARTVHWGAIAGVVVGALVGNFVPAGIASLNAMLAASLCYLAADRLVYSRG